MSLATDATRRIWVDANQDGEVDDGEEETQLTGGRSTDVGYSSSQASTASRLFSIGGVH